MEKVSLCSGKYTEKGYVQGRAKTGGDVQRGEMFKGGRVEMFTGGLRVAVRPGKTGGDVQKGGGGVAARERVVETGNLILITHFSSSKLPATSWNRIQRR